MYGIIVLPKGKGENKMGKTKKSKKFQIIIENDVGSVCIDSTNKKDVVDFALDHFRTRMTAGNIKIYLCNEDGMTYNLVHEESKAIPTERVIGFGRW